MNSNFDNPQLKSILWNGPQYLELKEQIYNYLKTIDERDEIDRMFKPSKLLPTIPVSTMFDYYQTEIFANTNFIFFSLPEEKKTFITMIHTSYDFVRTLVISFADIYSINEKEIRRKSEQQPPEEENKSLYEIKARWDEEDEEYNKRRRLELLQGKYSNLREYIEVMELFHEDYHKQIQKVLVTNPSTPSLRTVFDRLVQTKRIFGFILDYFYQMLEPIKHFHLDYKTYNTLYDSITEEDYNQFSKLIDSWDIEVIKELSILVDRIFPLVLYIESQATDSMLLSIRKGLTTIHLEQKFESSLISTLLVFLVDYVFINIMKNHINDIGRETLCSLFSIEFQAQHYEWINCEVEEIIDFFSSNLHEIQSNINKEKDDEKRTGSNEKKPNQEELDPETPEDSKQEHLSVPYSQGVIRKLAEGLVKGHDALDFPNLVSSEIGDDDAINKLVFLFKGKADILVKDPYNLQWNKNYNLNGLKLLIYLLHFTGEFKNNDPLNALDDSEKSRDGISELVKFKNTGRKRIFPIVEKAFNRGKKSIQNAPRPKSGNRFFLEQIVQFWFYCKNSDTSSTK